MLSERESVVSELLLGRGAEGSAINRPQRATITSASLPHRQLSLLRQEPCPQI